MTDLRLLLIEDLDDDAELLLAELARCGYRCDTTRACTREGVQQALDTKTFDLVISDYRMPQFTGADALAMVRARFERMPFIIVSGTIGEELAVDLIRSGANDYVMKGKFARLGVAVARELAAVRLSRQNASLTHDLQRTRERLAETVALAPVGICHTSPSGHWLMVNDALCDILGYSAEELRGKSFADLTHPDDVAKSFSGRDAMIAGSAPFRAEKRYVRKDGATVWTSIASTAVRDAAGEVEYFATVISDITERRRTQEELRRRALQQQAIALFGHMALAGCSREMLLEELTARLVSLTDADAADVFEAMPSGDAVLVESAGWSRDALVTTMDAESGSHVGYALATGMPISIASLSGDEPFAVPAMLTNAGIRSMAVVPIVGGTDGFFGTIGVYSRMAGQFGAEDEAFLRACTHVIAEAVQRQKNETELEVTARQQSALAEIAGRFLREPVDEPIRACDVIAPALEADYAAYLEIDSGGEFAVVVDGATWLGGPGARVPLVDTQAGFTVATSGAVVVADFETETRFNARPYFDRYGLRSGISVPVRGHGGVLGVIKVATRTKRDFNAEAVQFLQALADLVAEGLERRKTHRELAASRARYRNVFEGAAELIISVTPTGRILTLNQAFERLTGWSVDQWIGRDFIELVPEGDRNTALRYFADVRGDGSDAVAVRILTADGGTRDLEGSWVVVGTDGRVEEIFGFGRDVTERRRIEQARARLADELTLILDSVAEGIYRFDADGNCSMINRAAVNMLGGDRDAYVGGPLAPLGAATGDAEGMPRLLELVSSRQSVHVTEGTFMTCNGRLLPVEFSVAPLVRNDVVLGGVVCFWDISRRRQLETQLEQERRLSSLGRLAASVAHEFNNVMMGIGPFAEVIGKSAHRDLARASQHISDSVRRGKRITEEILRFANPAPPAVAPLDAQQWLARIEPEMRSLLTGSHSLHVAAEEGVAMLADASQVNQVVMNLTVNARDAMQPGGSLSVFVRGADISAAQSFALPRPAADYVHISVRDTGAGIAAENVAHIFEPLFTTKRSGTGLGLPISRQIIKRHGGEMFVETAQGEGTTFHIFLPRTTQPAANEAAVTRKRLPRLPASTRVLLVEDDTHVAAGLLLALREAGVTVQHVNTGEAAVTALSSGNVDAAIVDIGLPDLDGTKVYERAARAARVPVVFSTGHAEQAKVAPYLGEAHVAYLLKPYPIDTLLETLATVMPAG